MCLLVTGFLLVWAIANASGLSETSSTTPTPSPALQKPPTAAVYTANYKKRDVQVSDLSGAVSSKNYDPPAEYYRGPDSAASSFSSASSKSPVSSSGYAEHRDSATASFLTKPITFPDLGGRNNYNQDASSYQANEYNKWQALKGGVQAQDRISVKHFGSPDHGTGSTYTGGNGASYQYDIRPYGGGSHYYDSHSGGVSGAGVSYDGAGGIPFDVYGNKGVGGGDVYSYSQYPAIGHEASMKGQPELSQKALLAKSFLIPLASAAVLGIAAALVSNPLLLQLGTVGGGVAPALIGKRRRRRRRDLGDTSGAQKQSIGSTLAYGAHYRKGKM